MLDLLNRLFCKDYNDLVETGPDQDVDGCEGDDVRCALYQHSLAKCHKPHKQSLRKIFRARVDILTKHKLF